VDEMIRGAVERTYGSLERPNYGLVTDRLLRERPYDALIATIGTAFAVTDTTDGNDDNSFVLSLERDGGSWVLMLSVVGPFAALARVRGCWDEVLTDCTPGLAEPERWLLDRALDRGLRPLGLEELAEPLPAMPMFKAEPGDTRVYHALFSDASILPWDREVMIREGLI
jgi:hypothetical protein